MKQSSGGISAVGGDSFQFGTLRVGRLIRYGPNVFGVHVTKPQQKSQHSKEIQRVSDGFRVSTSGDALVNVTRHFFPKPDGTTQVQLSMNLMDAPTPARRYAAETGCIDVRDEIVRLMFGQFALTSQELRTLLVVRMYPDAVHRFLSTCDAFRVPIRDFLKSNGLQSSNLLTSVKDEPGHSVVVDSNVIALSFSGRAAEFDFYHVAPMAIRRIADNKGNELELDPVVRVDCPTTLLAAMLEYLTTIAESLPSEPL